MRNIIASTVVLSIFWGLFFAAIMAFYWLSGWHTWVSVFAAIGIFRIMQDMIETSKDVWRA